MTSPRKESGLSGEMQGLRTTMDAISKAEEAKIKTRLAAGPLSEIANHLNDPKTRLHFATGKGGVPSISSSNPTVQAYLTKNPNLLAQSEELRYLASRCYAAQTLAGILTPLKNGAELIKQHETFTERHGVLKGYLEPPSEAVAKAIAREQKKGSKKLQLESRDDVSTNKLIKSIDAALFRIKNIILSMKQTHSRKDWNDPVAQRRDASVGKNPAALLHHDSNEENQKPTPSVAARPMRRGK